MSIYAISDIHGQLELLSNLMDTIPIKDGDQFIFLGDYIDRGKNSAKVITYLIKFAQTYDCVFLKGNHEEMMLRCIQDNDPLDLQLWKLNGGNKTIRSYKGIQNVPPSHREFLANLKLMHETEAYIFVHAGIAPDRPLTEQKEDELLWIRDHFFSYPTNLKKKVIFGHTPIMYLKDYYNKDKIGIDYGAGIGLNLATLKLPEEEFIVV